MLQKSVQVHLLYALDTSSQVESERVTAVGRKPQTAVHNKRIRRVVEHNILDAPARVL